MHDGAGVHSGGGRDNNSNDDAVTAAANRLDVERANFGLSGVCVCVCDC